MFSVGSAADHRSAAVPAPGLFTDRRYAAALTEDERIVAALYYCKLLAAALPDDNSILTLA